MSNHTRTRLAYSEIVSDTLYLSFADGEEIALPLPERSFPVLVTDTREHVLWVNADTPEQALKYANSNTWEKVSDSETLVDSGMTVKLPADHWDWDTVSDGDYFSPYQGTRYGAHVEEHKRLLSQQEHDAKKAACAERGHTGNEYTWRNGRVECQLCLVTLVEAPTDRPQSTIVQPEAASTLSDRSSGAA